MLLNPKEAAQCLGIGRSKVYELMRAGTLESVRIGTCRRVPMAAVQKYIDRLLSETTGLAS